MKKIKSKPHSPLAAYIIGPLLVALGAAIFFLAPAGFGSYKVQSQAERWPRTLGTVISASIGVDEVTPHDQHQEQDMYQPLIQAGYRVDGRDYVINEIYIGQLSSWTSRRSSVAGIVARYSPGTEVYVYYSPDNPAIAVLEPGVDWGTWVLLAVSLAIALLGLLFLYVGVRDTYRFFTYYLAVRRHKLRGQ